MRRAVYGLAGLAAGTTLLVVVKGAASAGPAAPPVVVAVPTLSPGASAPPADPSAEPAPSATDGSPAPSGTPSAGPSKSTPTSSAPQNRPTSKAPSPTRSTAPPSGPYQVTGPIVANEYGAVQVQITWSGGRFTEVRALEMPESSSRSNQLSARAEPLLRADALRRQNADLDTVSGASYTSQSYRDSLQGAIDAANRGERG